MMYDKKTFEHFLSKFMREQITTCKSIVADLISFLSIKDVTFKPHSLQKTGIYIKCHELNSVDHGGIAEIIRKYSSAFTKPEFVIPKGFCSWDGKKQKKNKNTACIFLNYDFAAYVNIMGGIKENDQ